MIDQAYRALTALNPQLCVLATCGNNKPHAAVLMFIVKDDLSVILSTHKTSRKWNDLETNHDVSLTFGAGFTEANVQYDGTARLVTEGEEFETLSKEYYSAHPELLKFKTPENGFIVITPDWIRMSDYTQTPPRVEEHTF